LPRALPLIITASRLLAQSRHQRRPHRRYVRVALDHMKAEPDTSFASTLLDLIDARVKGAADRALFGLPALAKKEKPPPA
jgi:hypothetical protein